MAIPPQYRNDFEYLLEKSRKGTLNSDNAIYRKLLDRARNLPELQRALSALRVNYI